MHQTLSVRDLQSLIVLDDVSF